MCQGAVLISVKIYNDNRAILLKEEEFSAGFCEVCNCMKLCGQLENLKNPTGKKIFPTG